MEKFGYPQKNIEESGVESIDKNIESIGSIAPKIIEKEQGFMEKLNEKAKSVAGAMLLCTLIAAYPNDVEAGSRERIEISGASDLTKEEYSNRESGARKEILDRRNAIGNNIKDSRFKRKWDNITEKMKKQWEETDDKTKRTSELAEKMGIPYDYRNVSIETVGNIIVSINGQKVPLDLFTKDERMRFDEANKYGWAKEETAKGDKKNLKQKPNSGAGITVTESNDYSNLGNF